MFPGMSLRLFILLINCLPCLPSNPVLHHYIGRMVVVLVLISIGHPQWSVMFLKTGLLWLLPLRFDKFS
jgi:hypothetical protein